MIPHFPHEEPVIQELTAERTDRGIAILSVTILDGKLEEAIKRFIPNDNDLHERLFGARADALLRDFSKKADAAFAIGLVRKHTNADLRTLGQIRNQFAHKLLMKFDHQDMTKYIDRLRFYAPNPDATGNYGEIRFMIESEGGDQPPRPLNKSEKFVMKFITILHNINLLLQEPQPQLRTPAF
jgi:hypothetical protein